MNTKDFRFMKSAVLECSFNYSILNKEPLLFEITLQYPSVLYQILTVVT